MKDLEAIRSRAEALLEAGDYEGALGVVNAATAPGASGAAAGDAGLRILAGRSLAALGRLEEAAEVFLEADRLGSEDPAHVLLHLAWVYGQRDDTAAMIDAYERAAGQPGDSDSRRLAQARLTALVTGDTATAERLLREGATEYPNNPSFFTDLGDLLLRQERFREARDSFRRAARLAELPPARSYQLALAELGVGDRRAAIDALRAAIEAAPGFRDAYPLLIRLEFQTGRIVPALRHLLRAGDHIDVEDDTHPQFRTATSTAGK